jgi:hypothetical protein
MRMPIAFLLFFCCRAPASVGQARSILDPYPIGTPAAATITFGDAYSAAIEAYDARITVIEVIRGSGAWELMKRQDASSKEPDAGFEYVLARIRFEYRAKGKPGDKLYDLREDQFTAYSSDGSTQYPAADAPPPKPRLTGTLRSGDSAEGWIVVLVARNEPKPFTAFRAEVRLLSHSGIGPSLRLY